MMTHQLEVSILAAPLGAIDRRSLSQAWYSALRFAPQTSKNGSDRAPKCGRAPLVTPRAIAASNLPDEATAGALRARTRQEKPAVFVCGAQSPAAARAFRSQRRLAERIERAFSSGSPSAKRATFSLGPGDARVHVVMQTTGAQTTLLAICRPELRAIVARALAQARAALAARGVGVEFCAIGAAECS